MNAILTEERQQVLSTIRQFVEWDVKPVARELEKRDEYPFAIVERLKELGLFGAFIPEAYGGLGLDERERHHQEPFGERQELTPRFSMDMIRP